MLCIQCIINNLIIITVMLKITDTMKGRAVETDGSHVMVTKVYRVSVTRYQVGEC